MLRPHMHTSVCQRVSRQANAPKKRCVSLWFLFVYTDVPGCPRDVQEVLGQDELEMQTITTIKQTFFPFCATKHQVLKRDATVA